MLYINNAYFMWQELVDLNVMSDERGDCYRRLTACTVLL